VGQHRNVIAAAKAAGVGRIIYTSIQKADALPMLIATDHRATEEAIHAAGLPFTILRNGWYTENWTGTLAGSIAAGAVIGAAGDAQDKMESFGLPAGFAAVLVDVDLKAQGGWLADTSGTLGKLIGRPTTPLSEAVRAALG
jgi:uncharacterized protein YbjT (DUF2867 family)